MREPRRKSCGPQNVRPSTNPDASQQLHDPNVNGSTCIMVICLVRSMYLVLNVDERIPLHGNARMRVSQNAKWKTMNIMTNFM